MVLIDLLGVGNATVETWEVELCDANKSLEDEQDRRDQTEDRVGALEMCSMVRYLVILDDDETGNERKGGGAV